MQRNLISSSQVNNCCFGLPIMIQCLYTIIHRSNTKKEFVVQLNVSADQNNIPTDPVTFKAGQDVSVRLVDAGNPDRPREGLRVDKVLNKNGWNILKNKVHPNYNNANPVDVGSEW